MKSPTSYDKGYPLLETFPPTHYCGSPAQWLDGSDVNTDEPLLYNDIGIPLCCRGGVVEIHGFFGISGHDDFGYIVEDSIALSPDSIITYGDATQSLTLSGESGFTLTFDGSLTLGGFVIAYGPPEICEGYVSLSGDETDNWYEEPHGFIALSSPSRGVDDIVVEPSISVTSFEPVADIMYVGDVYITLFSEPITGDDLIIDPSLNITTEVPIPDLIEFDDSMGLSGV